MTPILEMSGICRNYGAVQALTDVDFVVHAGEVVALVGDNGAGKSTLIKVIAGVGPASSGTIRFGGQEVPIRTPSDAAALGIATVYQDLALCNNLDVASNLFLGRELGASGLWGYLRPLDKVQMARQSRDLLHSLRVKIRDVRVNAEALSGGQRQSIAIARSLLGDPKLVLLDEPTAALGVEQTENVLRLIREVRSRGHAVVVISHNLADVFDVADRISVLRLGRNAGHYEARSTSRQQIVSAITGADRQAVSDAGRGEVQAAM